MPATDETGTIPADETMSEPNTRYIHFTIDGGFINRTAIEKLWYENDFLAAMELLMSATRLADDVPYAKERQLTACLSILDGRSEIRGIYPSATYGVYPVDEKDREPGKSLADWFAHIKQELADAKEQARTARDKIQCIAEELSENMQIEIDAEWRTNWCDSDSTDRTIFGTSRQSQIQMAMAKDFIDRMESDIDEPDYGWLFPDGKFYPVEWGDHQSWAYDWLIANDPEFVEKTSPFASPDDYVPRESAGDYLSEHHRAILLHNPSLGTANATGVPDHLITKAQKEYLYDYYTKRGLTDKANAVWKE